MGDNFLIDRMTSSLNNNDLLVSNSFHEGNNLYISLPIRYNDLVKNPFLYHFLLYILHLIKHYPHYIALLLIYFIYSIISYSLASSCNYNGKTATLILVVKK